MEVVVARPSGVEKRCEVSKGNGGVETLRVEYCSESEPFLKAHSLNLKRRMHWHMWEDELQSEANPKDAL